MFPMVAMYKQTDTKFPKLQNKATKSLDYHVSRVGGQTRVIHKQSKMPIMSVMGPICQNSRKQLKHFITEQSYMSKFHAVTL